MESRLETGSCFCGAVAAEMHGEPFWICYDHDDDCRRAVGSPINLWVGYRKDQFRLTRGKPKGFSKTKGVVRTFCPECGTSISYLDEGLGDELYVTIGFLDRPEGFR
ncbi:MAG TPA: GFA family protein, partial [Geminicoccaceae bacterium]|nr:GFA family protein [Geminicoccaceae bacterium]